MKWATWFDRVDLILMKTWGVRAGSTEIPFRDYFNAGILPEQVPEQAMNDNYFIPKEKK